MRTAAAATGSTRECCWTAAWWAVRCPYQPGRQLTQALSGWPDSNRSATRRVRLNQLPGSSTQAAAIAADTPEPKAEAASGPSAWAPPQSGCTINSGEPNQSRGTCGTLIRARLTIRCGWIRSSGSEPTREKNQGSPAVPRRHCRQWLCASRRPRAEPQQGLGLKGASVRYTPRRMAEEQSAPPAGAGGRTSGGPNGSQARW